MLEFNKTVSADDHMVTADLSAYFRTTQSAWKAIENSLAASGRAKNTINTILDFGSGYGRVYRALVAAFPHAKLTACDLMVDGAKFCAETFGGDWVQSQDTLENVVMPRKYDLVWLGSVFTHLPEFRWHRLLQFLAEHTSTNGIVIFTSHGNHAIEHFENYLLVKNKHIIDEQWFKNMKANLPKTGFAFYPNKPAVTKNQHERGMVVKQGEYGFSFATKSWIRELIALHPDWEMINFSPGGWGNNHDVTTIRRQ